ncbi:MAG: histidine--tRNA ligase [Deltaproteobacteria bacterium]|nr:histidine--tRNA ligase [Deltaproteobacteria bacterium]
MSVASVKGVRDLLPGEAERWQAAELVARAVFRAYGFAEIRIPIIESNELFVRSVGEATDIVEKEMFTFPDRHGELLCLRPEGTAPVVRAFIENKLYATDPVAKLFYIGPMFRYERPQRGRYRQFHQIGAEVLGVAEPLLDAEVLEMVVHLVGRLGVTGVELQLNSLGDARCRPAFLTALQGFLRSVRAELCGDCHRRLEVNPLRVLDCKNEGCQAVLARAPLVSEALCAECRAHYEAVKASLRQQGVAFVEHPRLVRGLDYYVRTAFELVATTGLGAKNEVAAGGRYDGLVRDLGGPDVPGMGFAIGMERLMALLPEGSSEPAQPFLFVASVGQTGEAAWRLMTELRHEGVPAEAGYEGKSLKSQLRRAHKLGALYVAILGEDELNAGQITLRDMKAQRQDAVPLARARQEIVARWASR